MQGNEFLLIGQVVLAPTVLLMIIHLFSLVGLVQLTYGYICLIGFCAAANTFFFASFDLILFLILASSSFVIFVFVYAGFYKSLSARMIFDLEKSGAKSKAEIFENYGKSAFFTRLEMLRSSGAIELLENGYNLRPNMIPLLKCYAFLRWAYNVKTSG
jgi:hypothetical protein